MSQPPPVKNAVSRVVQLETGSTTIPNAGALANNIVIWYDISGGIRRLPHLEEAESIAVGNLSESLP